MKKDNIKKKVALFEWIDSLIVAFVIILILFVFVFKFYISVGGSMLPTINENERVFVWSLFYKPNNGDIIIIDARSVPSIQDSIIKRVIATEGQTVDIDEVTGELTVDGIPVDVPIESTVDNINGDVDFPQIVPNDSVFVLGDNRGASHDSRFSDIGMVDQNLVIGKAMFKISPSFEVL